MALFYCTLLFTLDWISSFYLSFHSWERIWRTVVSGYRGRLQKWRTFSFKTQQGNVVVEQSSLILALVTGLFLLTLTNQFGGCTFLANKVFSWKLFLHIAATLARRRHTHPCLKLASQTCYGKTCQGLKFLSRDGHKRTDFMETVKGLSKIIL